MSFTRRARDSTTDREREREGENDEHDGAWASPPRAMVTATRNDLGHRFARSSSHRPACRGAHNAPHMPARVRGWSVGPKRVLGARTGAQGFGFGYWARVCCEL